MKIFLSRRRAALLVVTLLLTALGTYQLFFSERIETVVKGRIYRSAQLSGNALEKLVREKGIRTVINLRGGSRDAEWHRREHEITEKNNIALYDFTISPHDLPGYSVLQSIVDALSRSERPVLIHCRRGSDRTGMVSALALALEQDAPLADLQKQFSWRYGVFPFYRSVGPRLFSQYEEWLAGKKRPHNKSNLIYWVENGYVDEQGNLEFWISDVNGVRVRDRKIRVDGRPKKLVMEGWAFDLRTKSRPDDLRITIGKGISANAAFQYDRSDVARNFGLGERYYENFRVGWRAELETGQLGEGCSPVSVTFTKDGTDTRRGLEGFQVCF